MALCFRDRSYCSSSQVSCQNTQCSRFFGPDQEAAAKRWWQGMDGDPPVAFMDLGRGCKDRVPVPGFE